MDHRAEPINGIMFQGQSSVAVYNRRKGWMAQARVQYYPMVQVLGPVSDPETGEVLDTRPVFEYPTHP